MPKPRIPQERARVTGAIKTNPARFDKRGDPQSSPIGNAPAWMDATQVQAWECFRSELPWLMESDRTVLEVASKLRARLWTEPDMGISAINQLRMCAAQLGATPADRTKITVSDEPDEDPTDRYFN